MPLWSLPGMWTPKRPSAVKELFGIPSRPAPRPPIHLEPVKPEMIRLKTDLPYGLAVVAFRLPGYGSPDYAASQVLADVLNSQRSDLFALVPGKSFEHRLRLEHPAPGGTGLCPGRLSPGRRFPGPAQDKGIIDRLSRRGFPPTWWQPPKTHAKADAEYQKDSVSGLAYGWSQALAVEGRQSPEDNVKAIEKVTVADVERLARPI